LEFGASELRDAWLGIAQPDLRGPIHQDQVRVWCVRNGTSGAAQQQALGVCLDELFDQAGEQRAA
jgi:hypothetical protein